ncbi:MAG: inorganic phosphate transporter [Alphaproteobacteria bacterium]|nr:MAG: inorganic phosphate transporter [Alphaproteobacteria bacterium]
MIIFGAALFLAYANGANDNFKGVATLWGSGVASFRTALAWATVSTFAGSLAAAAFAEKLLTLFSGKGLVPEWLIGTPAFALAVILAAGLTVFLAALRGIPISTTHSLVGAIMGAGLIAAGSELNFAKLGQSFLLPLALGPILPILIITGLYPMVRRVVTMPALDDWFGAPPKRPAMALARSELNEAKQSQHKTEAATAIAVALNTMRRSADCLHFLSAGAVGFARGLNDTPKIVAIALAAGALDLRVSIFFIAIAMALGGLLQSRRVAVTMSNKITPLSPAQGTLANVITSLLVIMASSYGLPVSTTHVSVGAIMGIGVAERNANWRLLSGIASAWVLTLPTAMILSGLLYWGLTLSGLVG